MSEQQSYRGQVDRMLGQIVSHGRRFEEWTSEDRQWVIDNPHHALALFMRAVSSRDAVQPPTPGAEDLKIRELFTLENAQRLGFSGPTNARILNLTELPHSASTEPIRTLGDLTRWTENELRRIPNLGHTSVAYIKVVLAEYGLRLA